MVKWETLNLKSSSWLCCSITAWVADCKCIIIILFKSLLRPKLVENPSVPQTNQNPSAAWKIDAKPNLIFHFLWLLISSSPSSSATIKNLIINIVCCRDKHKRYCDERWEACVEIQTKQKQKTKIQKWRKTPKPSSVSDYCLMDLVNLWWFPVFTFTTVKFWSIVVSSSRASLVNLFTQGQLWFTKLDYFWNFWKGVWGGGGTVNT